MLDSPGNFRGGKRTSVFQNAIQSLIEYHELPSPSPSKKDQKHKYARTHEVDEI